MAPTTAEEYWALVDDHWEDLENIFYQFLPMHEHVDYLGHILGEQLGNVVRRLKKERSLDLPRYFNAAWSAAPDNALIHEIQGWGILCDLCSEEWCLHEESDQA